MYTLSDTAFDLAQATLFDIREMEDLEMECSFERMEYEALIAYGEMAYDLEKNS